jgi:hypothetical protein
MYPKPLQVQGTFDNAVIELGTKGDEEHAVLYNPYLESVP